jgi:Uma2 family endonuclease
MPVTEKTFEALVLEDPEGRWELFRGRLREKPPMSFAHNQASSHLVRQLVTQLDPSRYQVRQNAGHVRARSGDTYIPDVAVIPVRLMTQFRNDPARLEIYDDPLPFVAEIWSPSTGSYDVDTKLPAYRERGDEEIWRLHPFERSLRIWRRQPDGGYAEQQVMGGIVRLHALPDVAIALDELFQFA